MMKRWHHNDGCLATCAVLVLSGGGSMARADAPISVPIRVVGEIATSSCELHFANNGNYDYGFFYNTGDVLDLPEKTLLFRLSCDGPAPVSLSFVDNRSGTSLVDGPTYFGLGMQNSRYGAHPIGDYRLSMDDIQTRGAIRLQMLSSQDGHRWSNVGYGPLSVQKDVQVGFVLSSGSSTPEGFVEVTGIMHGFGRVNGDLFFYDPSFVAHLDGNITVLINYL